MWMRIQMPFCAKLRLPLLAVMRACAKRSSSLAIHEKKQIGYKERSEEARAAYQEEIAQIPESRRIYVDECGIAQDLQREYGRAPRGMRIYGMVSGRKFARLNVVAGYCNGRKLAEYCYRGITTAKVFEDWFCTYLLPETRIGDVIILDNASFHNEKRLRACAAIYKVSIIFLPPYSPDYNPIEHVWANLKQFIRNTHMQFASLQSAAYWCFDIGYT